MFEGLVSVVDVLIVPGVVFVGELSENVSRDLPAVVVFDGFPLEFFFVFAFSLDILWLLIALISNMGHIELIN